MFVLNVILAVVIAVPFLVGGIGKILDVEMMAIARQHLGLPPGLFRIVGILEFLGGVGVLAGLHQDLPLIGILAAIGLIGMTIGAGFYHQKAGDTMKQWLPAVVMGSLPIFYIILRIATA